jgi:DNA transformation protein
MALDPDTIQDLFRDFGAVSVRRMFGGAGLYAEGVMFGLVSDQQIYLKADAATAQDFSREGCAPFEYATKAGKRSVMSFWRMPERLYDDPGELALWARKAVAVAHKSAAAKPKARRNSRRQPSVRRPGPSRRRRR